LTSPIRDAFIDATLKFRWWLQGDRHAAISLDEFPVRGRAYNLGGFMAQPKKPSTRIIVEVKLKVPRTERLPTPTKAQLAKLAKTFKSDIVASLGVRSNDVCTRMSGSDGRLPRSKR